MEKLSQWQKSLFETHYDTLLKVAFRYVSTYEQALEVTHHGFLKIFHEFVRFKINQNVKFPAALAAWIKRIFIISLVDQIKSEIKLQMPGPIPEDIWKQNDRVLSDIEFKYIELIKILKGLPVSCRLVFNLYIIDGFSSAEIAGMLGITVKDLKYDLIKARKYCYESLAERKNIKQ